MLVAADTRDVLVLCYHAVSEDWPADLSITPAAFERQVGGLLRRGWTPATFTDAVLRPPAAKTLAVTFDDAYRSVGERARPILDRLGAPATVFVPTDWPDCGEPMHWPGIEQWLGTPHEPELVPHTWDELRALDAHGWEVGAHTCSHPHLTGLDDEALARELTASRAVCMEALGHECTSVAYPYGDADARVVAAAGAAGYRAAAALPGSFATPAALEFPRVGVWHVDGRRGWRFRLKVGPARAIRRRRGG